MQFSVIRSYCGTRFRDVSNQVVSDADWKNYVNTAYGDVLIKMPFFPWNEASSTLVVNASSRGVALPTNVWRVTAVYNSTDQFPMVPLEGRNQVYSEYPQQTEIGQPMHYRIFGSQLQVYPMPQANTSFVVEYSLMPADLVADADVPAFPEQYHDMLVSGAVALAYRDDGNPDMAKSFEGEFESMLQAMIRDAMQPRQDRYYEPTDTFM